MRKYIAAIIGICATLLFLVGCKVTSPTSPNDNNPLVGTWKMTHQITTPSQGIPDTLFASTSFGNTYVFGRDNSLNCSTILFGVQFDLTGTWSSTADSVSITVTGGSSKKWKYSVSGSNLSLTRGEVEGSGVKTTAEYYAKQ